MANIKLTNAKRTKNDEFYTQYSDIQKEVEAYLEYDPNVFKNKIVYCNCDDPYESNFFRYFVLNFKRIGLKQLITTSYRPSPIANTQLELFYHAKRKLSIQERQELKANRFVINDVSDIDGDGEFSLRDVAIQLRENKHNEWIPIEGDGDFRSKESKELLKQADIVVTNPPWSLFREYINQLVEYNKKFLVIGNLNAITYKEIFPLLKDNKIWLGNNYKVNAGAMYFEIPEEIANLEQVREIKTAENGKKIYITRVQGVRWFTNLDHGRRHQPIPLMTKADVIKYVTKKPYEHYENYNAIEVSKIKNIPSDYAGIMGVPVSILDNYDPDQFEILGMCENEDLYGLKKRIYATAECKQAYLDKFGKKGTYDLNASGVVKRNGILVKVYQRILIKHRKVEK